MSFSRAQAEAAILPRLKGWYAEIKVAGSTWDITTVDGTNPYLNNPIGSALTEMGTPPADPTLVADSDLAGVTAASWSEFTTRAVRQGLRDVRTNLAGYSIQQAYSFRTWQSDQTNALDIAIKDLDDLIGRRWGIRTIDGSRGGVAYGPFAAGPFCPTPYDAYARSRAAAARGVDPRGFIP